MQICPNCGGESPDRFRMCGMCGAELAAAGRWAEARVAFEGAAATFEAKGNVVSTAHAHERLDHLSEEEVAGGNR